MRWRAGKLEKPNGRDAVTARELRPLGDALGTEALGVDLSKPLDDETFAWIEDAFAAHPVLVFRDQDLGPGELAAFGRRFGRPKIHSLVDYRHAEFPEVSWLTNVDKDGNIDWFGVKRATNWHTDSPYEEVPPRLAILHAKEVPSAKGGTMFADMRGAYDALDEAMKQRLAGLAGLHGRHDGPAGVRLYEGDPEQNLDRVYAEKARPAVIQHSVTGRPILFVNPLHTHGFQGMQKDEAWKLIEELAEHSTHERFVYYHAWWRRRADVGRTGDNAPRRRRLPARRTPGDATHHCLPELGSGGMPALVSELNVRDVTIKLHRAGRGPTVLFLHGAGGVPQWLPFFDALAERHEVLVPEHPGFGGSDDPKWIRSMPDLAMFYLDLVEEAWLDKVHLIGNSLGGWLAAEILIRDRSR